MFRTQTRRGSILAVLTAAFTLVLGGLAQADNVENDVVASAGGEIVPIIEGGSATVSFQVKNSSAGGSGFSGCDPADGSALTLTLNVPSGVTVSPATLGFTTCDTLKSASFSSSTAGTYAITVSSADTHGNYNLNPARFTLEVTEPAPDEDADGVPDADDNCPAVANGDQADGDGDGIGTACDNCPTTANADQADTDGDNIGNACEEPDAPDGDGDGVPDATDNCPEHANFGQENADSDTLGDACDPNSYAPEVDEQADNADGLEGTPGNPETSGSFSDQDGNDSLTLSIGATDAGTLTDNGDGSFSWSHTTTDDDTGTVTVTASDGEHTDATQSFTWTADNVAPVLGSVSVTRTGACSVSLSAPFTDQGSADTHTASIDWDDGTTGLVDPATSPVTGTHTYASNGTYTVGVTVTDDDTGTDSADAATAFATQNTASALLQPINANGTRSVFKLGSTIPVKITVTGCDGLPVTTLTPVVTITKLDGSPDGGTTESPASAVATNGLMMRWSDGIYIYNLSTKLSQQYSAPLSAGSYRITVSDPSFVASTSALVELRK